MRSKVSTPVRQGLIRDIVTLEEEDYTDAKEKVKQKLSKYITNEKELDKLINSLVRDINDIESEPNSPASDLPYKRDEFMPWQESILEPGNPFSLATAITMKTINKPELPVFAPKGVPEKRVETEKPESPKESKPRLRESTVRGMQHRLSVRGNNLNFPRGSMISEISAQEDSIHIPKIHQEYFGNLVKQQELENHASWISFILFEETKRLEMLAMLEEEDEEEEIALLLRKRSSNINLATSAIQDKNFTKHERNFNRNEYIMFDKKRYDRRRASSVIQKITTPLPKEVIECMKQFKTWNFDAFLLNDLTSNNPLSFFMQYIFQAYGLGQKLEMDKTKFQAFFYEIQEL
jgi:hypothetical protein